jgi:DNA invertase Pin-like site-specific DNA recombinase
MTAIVYARKSVMRDDTKSLSLEVQEARCRALAQSKGADDIRVIRDAGISGAKVEARPGYMDLLRGIEAGEVQSVYAYDMSRLHRNTKEALRFYEMTEARGVAVCLVTESIDTSTAMGRMMMTVLAAVNAMISQVSSEKIRASLDLKREQGWRAGGRLYGEIRSIEEKDGNGVVSTRIVGQDEDTAAVVQALRETGSYRRAAVRLNKAGVPTRNKKSRGWTGTAVQDIVTRVDPDLINDMRASGPAIRGSSAAPRSHRLARLLRCSVCAALLVPSYDRQRNQTRYYCQHYGVPGHARNAVTEAAVMPAVIAAVARTQIPGRRVNKGANGPVVDVTALAAKRERYAEMYGTGDITRERWEAVKAEIAEQEASAIASSWVRRYAVPPDVEQGDPAKVNEWLRRVFTRFTVDMTTTGKRGQTVAVPAEAVWSDPSLMLDDPDEQTVPGLVPLKGQTVERDGDVVDVSEKPVPLDTRSIEEIAAVDPEYATYLRAQESGAPAGATRRRRGSGAA